MSSEFDPVFDRSFASSSTRESDLVTATLSAEIAYWRKRATWEEERRQGAEQRERGLLAEVALQRGVVEHLRQEVAQYRREQVGDKEATDEQAAALRRRIAEVSEETYLIKQRVLHAEKFASRPAGQAEKLWDSVRHAATRLSGKSKRTRAA